MKRWKIKLNSWIKIKYMNSETKAVFSPGSMFSSRKARKISNYLVRAKLYFSERHVCSRQYKKHRWNVCNNVTETYTFSSTVTGAFYHISMTLIVMISVWSLFSNVKFAKNNMYLLSCAKFVKLDYVAAIPRYWQSPVAYYLSTDYKVSHPIEL